MAAGDEDLDDWPFELPELPQVRRTPVRRDAPGGQASCQHVSLEARPRANNGIHTAVDGPKTPAADGVFELALREAAGEPLPPSQQPVLSRRQCQ
jgi:hypothetical protein